MKKVFHGLNRDRLYQRCLLGSIAHAIMVGEYGLLSAAQSWDGQNYNFMEDVIAAAVDEDEDIPNKKILKAIQYYDEYDTFMELD